MEDYPQDLLEFEARFATEEACRDYLFALRWPNGFRCPGCGHERAWPVRKVWFECARCGRQTSVTAGTREGKTMLEIRDLHARVEGAEDEILRGVTLKVNAGEVHSIMGPNGSGKSTLASVIAGRDGYEVTSGDVIYQGEGDREFMGDWTVEEARIPAARIKHKNIVVFIGPIETIDNIGRAAGEENWTRGEVVQPGG